MNHALRINLCARDDTIVAIGSPPGRSARGLIRLAGPETDDVLKQMLVKPPAATGHLEPVRLHRPPIPALAVRFGAPHSYCGQSMAEIQVPGHPALLDRLHVAAVSAGARPAEPGEFTFRAFAAGRIDLTQAEGVAATIAAVSDGELEAARLLREGRLGSFAADLVDGLGARLALVEAGIDFTDEEDVVAIAPAPLDRALADAERRLDDLLAGSRRWGAIEAVPRAVLIGPPSSGKSSLFNALLEQPRAVPDPAGGTTRDVLEEPMQIRLGDGRRVEVMLVDIAGLDEPRAPLDRRVQAAARRAIERADLLIRLGDAPLPGATPHLRVHAMCDLGPGPGLNVSALTGENVDGLRAAIGEALARRATSPAGRMLALQPRHESALHAARGALAAARSLLKPQRGRGALTGDELIAGHLRAALDELAALGGRLTPDDVIGKVFAHFCVGK